MTEIIATLLKWAVVLSPYSAPDLPPQVEFKPHGFFVENACDNKPCNVLGWYNDNGIVYFDERIKNAETPYQRSIWVHEFVHYLQHRNGNFDSEKCRDRLIREREAYIIQREYMVQVHGKTGFLRPRLKGC